MTRSRSGHSDSLYGSGMLPITRTVKTGVVFDVVGILIVPFCVAIVETVLGYA